MKDYMDAWMEGVKRLGGAEYHIETLISVVEKIDPETFESRYDKMNAEIAVECAREFIARLRAEDAERRERSKEAMDRLLATN